MEPLYFSVNPNPEHLISGHLILFSLISVVGIFIGYAVYLLLWSPPSRRKKFRHRGFISRGWSAAIGGCIALIIVGYAYWDNWMHFFQINVHGNKLELSYFLPLRTREISKEDILEISTREELRKVCVQHRLIIQTRDGKEYSSQLTLTDAFEKNYRRLKDQGHLTSRK